MNPLDGWALYCAAFHELFGDKPVELSPIAIDEAIQQAVKSERARCAEICDQHASVEGIAQRIMAQILEGI